MALSVEDNLEFIISNYFVFPQNEKTFLLNDSIITTLKLEQKIEIFKSICRAEKIEDGKVNKIVAAIRYVQRVRNRVAHDEGYMFDPKEGIRLHKRKSGWHTKDELIITDDIVKEVDKNRLYAIRGLVDIHIELSDVSRKKEPEIIG